MVRNNRSELDIPEQSQRGLEAEYGISDEEEVEDIEYDLDDEDELEEQITKGEKAGYGCSNQLFCYIRAKREPALLDYRSSLECSAESTKRSQSEASDENLF